MKLLTTLAVLLAAAPAAAGPAIPTSPPARHDRPASEVVIEAGMGAPLGDLGAHFETEPLGFGAGSGLELGFRWRWYVNRSLSLSPSFHFTDFHGFSGRDPDFGDYRIDCSTYRYTLELMWRTAPPDASLRPFVAVGAGLFRNRVTGYTKTFELAFDESVNTLGLTARAGFAVSELEFSVAYHLNRFSTWRYFDTGEDQAYDWDVIVLRGAWVLPFGD
ncbi:MAG TPA: hypothetical protein PLQ13_04425 [Candidatus Krumholzibacteria bacterium]|nr:hypothetical protein [Candidatus Krumholzibacteria bacterium]